MVLLQLMQAPSTHQSASNASSVPSFASWVSMPKDMDASHSSFSGRGPSPACSAPFAHHSANNASSIPSFTFQVLMPKDTPDASHSSLSSRGPSPAGGGAIHTPECNQCIVHLLLHSLGSNAQRCTRYPRLIDSDILHPQSRSDDSELLSLPNAIPKAYPPLILIHLILLSAALALLPQTPLPILPPPQLARGLDKPQHPFLAPITARPALTLAWACLGVVLLVPWWAGSLRRWTHDGTLGLRSIQQRLADDPHIRHVSISSLLSLPFP